TGRLLRSDTAEHDLRATLRHFVVRSGEPVVRQAVTAAMHILGRQFVIGRTIEEAVERAREAEQHGYRHSYDMRGEAAHTAADADGLELALDVSEMLVLAPELAGWDGLGLAVQAYQKRALPLIEWLADLARRGRRPLMVRLVKGAYWDSEIKHTQERGLDGYPVFTRKVATDVSYLACANRIFAAGAAFYPQFATHNAHTLAAPLESAGQPAAREFQACHR